MSNIVPLKAPPNLCIYQPKLRYETLNFIREIDRVIYKQGSNVKVDLTEVTFASAAASVLLFAVLSRAQFLMGDSLLIRILLPKKSTNSQGYRWIVSTGLGKALLANSSEKLEALVNEKRYFQSSVDPEQALVKTVNMLTEKALFTDEQVIFLAMGINEAMLNVRNHAYEDIASQNSLEFMGGKRWWQCAWFDEVNDRVVFIICDLGIGIGSSFANEDLSSSENLFTELSSVEKALTSGSSRFHSPGRGNGSEDIKRPIGSGCTQNERLLVFTGRALYRYEPSASEGQAPVSEYLPARIQGTIVQWSLVPKRD
ncbi:MAG: hypothetical protein LKK36_14975 [Ewingella americana]|uniref:hypothetical protein n=1 Tax=Ewingella americana TaxID=41202 RepID=UPI00242E740D|nr:hypothetical protein [Ewingella americana]MCI1678990.1 hypothetical protein [Ewingella americana]MCI1852366.1 hypothetical protein [Ewingella americana]MCI1862768.1 hypothetical protein [Ewingella americana]MCI2141816.1 hypothetical protein [Ewingella americana]MCI2164974.1 hypothetical protein [Ewingella americana]